MERDASREFIKGPVMIPHDIGSSISMIGRWLLIHVSWLWTKSPNMTGFSAASAYLCVLCVEMGD